jgi:hypothetical protein
MLGVLAHVGLARRAGSLLVALALLLAVVAASSAQTSPVGRSSPAPPLKPEPGLTQGFAYVPMPTNPIQADGSLTPDPWMQKAASVGGGIVRVQVVWSAIAPAHPAVGFVATDPASPGYNWTSVDAEVREIVAAGMQPMLMLYLAPKWAEGPSPPPSGNPGSWEPDPGQFAEFATAAATRYSGNYPDPASPGTTLPQVHYWQAWNEPNLAYYLSPQWTAYGEPNSPTLYRALLNGFYAAVTAVDPTNFVLSAGTSPYGDPPTVFWPGGQRMPPLVFYRSLFCLTSSLQTVSCPGPVYLNGIDHHPYEVPPPQRRAARPDDVAIPDIWKITRLLNAAVKAGTVLPNASKQVWVGELTWDTNPPSLNSIAAPIAEQACYIELADYLLWHQGVSTILELRLQDAAPLPPWNATFDWGGIYFYSGAPKPSATAFHFPLVAWRQNATRVQIWGRAPASGILTLKRRLLSGRWKVISRNTVAADQVFLVTSSWKGPVDVQASVGASKSLPWTTPTATCLGH